MSKQPSIGEALRDFRTANHLCQNEREARWWIVRAGPAALPLPNFAWRRRAIDAHDAHHLLTGYPCTVEGELLIAAWEWGAGRYPHWGATLFCGPLVLAGLLYMPRRILGHGTTGGEAEVSTDTPISKACSTCRSTGREPWCAKPYRHPELVSGSSSPPARRRIAGC